MPDIRLQDYVTKIKDLIHTDRHDEAIAHCQHILRHYPKHIETYGLLGEACLEKSMYREAIEFFQRTLSADPENFIARVGLGIIYDEQGSLPEAIWQMERAFELAPGNTEVRRELQRLYAQRDGAEKARLKLTRGALGRLYSRNGLYERAIVEFHAVLRQDPDLPDIRVALVEALWREGRRLEVVETCLELLDVLPYCLKANLILGEIWTLGGHEDAGEEKLQTAQALDPENRVAHEMMGKESPLPPREVTVPLLDVAPDTLALIPMGEEPEAGWEPDEAGLALMAAGELAGEWEEGGDLPDWLTDMGVGQEDIFPGSEEAAAEAAAADLGEQGAPPEEEMPDWLQELMGDEAVPLGQGAVPVPEEPDREFPEEIPDWLRDLQEEAPAPGVPGAVVSEEEAVEPAEEGEPEGLQDMEAPRTEPEASALDLEEDVVVPPGDEVPESLRALVEAGILNEADLASAMAEMSEEDLEAQQAEDVPEWLQDLMTEETPAADVARASAPEEEVVEPPAQEPSFEAEPGVEPEVEALPDWLDELAAAGALETGPEVEEAEEELPDWLRAMRPQQVEEVPSSWATEEDIEGLPDWLRELGGEQGAPLPPAAREETEEVPEWLQDLRQAEAGPGTELEAGLEAGPQAEEEAEEAPEWMEEVGEPGAEEAPAAEAMAPPLEEEAPGVEAIPGTEESEDIPDWLRDLPAPEAEEAEPLAAEEEAVAPPSDDVPESLRALVEAGILDEADLASAMAEMSEEELEAQRAEEVPEWLRDLMGEEAPAAGLEAGPLADAVTPPVEEAAPKVEAIPEAEEVEEVPEWLRDLGEPAAEVVTPPVEEAAPEVEAIPEGKEAEEVPDWLRDLRPAEPEAEAVEEVPEWLRELGAPAAEVVAPPLEEEAPGVEAMPEVEEAGEVPEWLRELQSPEAEKPEPLAGPEAPAADMEEDLVVPPGDEVPESLRALVEAGILNEADLASAMAEMSEEELEAQRAEKVPEWLRDLMEEESSAAAPPAEAVPPSLEEEVIEPVIEAEAVAPPPEELVPKEEPGPEVGEEAEWLKELEAGEEVPPDEEELPDWLHELMGEEVPAVDVTQAQAVDEAMGPPEEEDLPEWLREWEEAEFAEAGAGIVEEMAPEQAAPTPVAEEEEVAPEPVMAVEAPAVEVEAEEMAEEPERQVPVAEQAIETEEQAPPEAVQERRGAPALEEMVMEAPEAGPVAEKTAAPAPPEEKEEETGRIEVLAELEAAEPEVEAGPPPGIEMVAPYDRVEVEEDLPAERQIDSLVQQLKANPRDYPQRLELARLYREERDWRSALAQYQKLISARKFLPAVLGDLGDLLQEDAEVARVYQLMGDAYMQQDELDKALEMYRLAQQALLKH